MLDKEPPKPTTLETAALDHACNVIRRRLQDELDNLTLHFIVHAPGGRAKALEKNTEALKRMPAGETLIAHLQALPAEGNEVSGLAAAGVDEKTGLLPPFRKHVFFAVFFVNIEDFPEDENPDLRIYYMIWHALSLVEAYKNNEEEKYVFENKILRPAKHIMLTMRTNLLADAFAAFMVSQQTGQKAVIRKLAQKRTRMALQALPDYAAELYPYPVTADAGLQLYHDVLDRTPAKMPNLARVTEMVRETDQTYDDAVLKQWRQFALRAQEMAWMEHDKSRILSAAIYTSEDAYVRAMAYLVAEILNMEPSPLSPFENTHNPFTEAEANNRLHWKKCQDSFASVMGRIKDISDTAPFKEEAQRQNERLIEGQVTGWCAHALYDAMIAMQGIPGAELAPAKDPAQAAFEKGMHQISWETLHALSRRIMFLRRAGKPHDIAAILKLCLRDEQFSLIGETLKKAAPVS